MIVCYTCDSGLFEHMKPVVKKLLACGGKIERVYIGVTDPVTKHDLGLDNLNVDILDFSFLNKEYEDPYKKLVNMERPWPIATFGRCYFPEALKDVKKGLYLDVDTWVCKSLNGLENINLTGLAGAAVREPIKSKYYSTQQMDVFNYYNTGVMYINFDFFRVNEVAKEVKNMVLTSGEKLVCPDQDALNFLLGKYIKSIGSEFNSCVHTGPVQNPVIEHCTPIRAWSEKSKYYKEYVEFSK